MTRPSCDEMLEIEPLADLLGAIAAEATWLAEGDDMRFASDLALRLQG